MKMTMKLVRKRRFGLYFDTEKATIHAALNCVQVTQEIWPKLTNIVCRHLYATLSNLYSTVFLRIPPSKCEHGGTQKANEAYHHLLWKRCQKEKFCRTTRIKLAVAISTIGFNDGEVGLTPAFQQIGLFSSPHHRRYAQEADARRVKKSNQMVFSVNGEKTNNLEQIDIIMRGHSEY